MEVKWTGDYGDGGGGGSVVGPASSTVNALARWSTTDGSLLNNSGILLDNTNNLSGSGISITFPSGFTISDNSVLHISKTSGMLGPNIMDLSDSLIFSLVEHKFADIISVQGVGSETAPGIRFDTPSSFGTGFWQPVPDSLAISVGGVQRAAFDVGGALSISGALSMPEIPTATGSPVGSQYNASSSASHGLVIIGNGSNGIASIMSFGGATGRLRGYAAGGTVASPSAVTGTGGIIQIEAQGFDGTTFAGASSIQLRNTETWSGTAHGSDIVLNVVPNTTTSSVIGLHVRNSGQVTLQPSGTTQLLDINSATETAGADTLTLTNGPSGTAGDPDVYLKVVINGTNYVIPAWAV